MQVSGVPGGEINQPQGAEKGGEARPPPPQLQRNKGDATFSISLALEALTPAWNEPSTRTGLPGLPDSFNRIHLEDQRYHRHPFYPENHQVLHHLFQEVSKGETIQRAVTQSLLPAKPPDKNPPVLGRDQGENVWRKMWCSNGAFVSHPKPPQPHQPVTHKLILGTDGDKCPGA